MTSDLNPVQVAIRDHVTEHYPAWRKREEEPAPTRAGLRYTGAGVGRLLAPVLEAIGLGVWENYEVRLFVGPDGRQWTRARLGDLIAGALADHPDGVLRASVGSSAFLEHIADRMPYVDSDAFERVSARTARSANTNADHARAYRDRRREDETASAVAFLRAFVEKGFARPGERLPGPVLYDRARDNIGRKVEEGRTGYGSPYITDEDDSPLWAVPGRSLFYALADEVLGARKRTARGYVWEIVRKAARRVTAWRKRPLSPETEEALRAIAALVRGAATEEPAPRRLRWRGRPLSPETEAALRGIAAHVREVDA